MSRFVVASLVFCFALPMMCFAQADGAKIIAIKVYMAKIDSLIKKNALVQSVADGIVKKKFFVINDNSGKKNKKQMNYGSFSEYTTYNLPARDSIYKIEYIEETDHNFCNVYYYRQNKPIASILTVKDGAKILLSKEEFYDNEKNIFQSVVRDPSYLNNAKMPVSLFNQSVSSLKSNLSFLKIK